MGRGGRGYIPDSLVLPRDKTDKIALVDVSHRTNSGVSERLPDEREPGYPHGNVRFIIIFLFFTIASALTRRSWFWVVA
jgi:hypothetical protein